MQHPEKGRGKNVLIIPFLKGAVVQFVKDNSRIKAGWA
jgi:hypothetical protein